MMNLNLTVAWVQYYLEIAQALTWAIGYEEELKLESINSSPCEGGGPFQTLSLTFRGRSNPTGHGPVIVVYHNSGAGPRHSFNGEMTCLTLSRGSEQVLVRWDHAYGDMEKIRRIVEAWRARYIPDADSVALASDLIRSVAHAWRQRV